MGRRSLAVVLALVFLLVSGGQFVGQARATELWVVEIGAPRCGVAWPYLHLIGNFHNHTIAKVDDHEFVRGYRKETEEARRLGLEVFGLSDHDQEFTAELLLAQRTFARSVSSANLPFVALAGWEWTIGSLAPWAHDPVAHINGFGGAQLVQASAGHQLPGAVVATSLEQFYLLAPQLASSSRLVLQFNHPWAGTEHFRQFVRPANFAAVEPLFALCEVDSGLLNSLREGINYWHRALQEGWRVAPTANNDSEGGINRASRDRSTGVWVERAALASDPQRAVLDALRARRCYARKAHATLQFGLGTSTQFAIMGSRLAISSEDELVAEFEARADGFFSRPSASLFLVRPGTVDRQRLAFREFVGQKQVVGGHIAVKVPADTLCVYLGFADGTAVLVSAPVWLIRAATTSSTPRPPAATIEQLRLVIAPSQTLRLAMSCSAAWQQMLVIRRDGVIAKTCILTRNGQRETFGFINREGREVVFTFEPYHRSSAREQWQRTRLSLVQQASQPPLFLFEDGDDQDYDDLIVEIYRE